MFKTIACHLIVVTALIQTDACSQTRPELPRQDTLSIKDTLWAGEKEQDDPDLLKLKEMPYQPTTLLDLPLNRKVEQVKVSLKNLQAGVSSKNFEKMREDNRQLFDEGSYVTLITKNANAIRLTTDDFYKRARRTKARYELSKLTVIYFDDFRHNLQDKWYCRATTYHDVNTGSIDQKPPQAKDVTSVLRLPVSGDVSTRKAGFWQIYNLTVYEK